MSLLTDLQERLKTDQSETARVLGLAKSTYSQYKTGKKPMPLYIEYSVEVILMLTEGKLKELKYRRLAPD